MSYDHYLRTYAEPQGPIYAARVDATYAHGIVVPLYDEEPGCLRQVFHHHAHADALVIAVVNAPVSATADSLARTRTLLKSATANTGPDVLVVDCASPGLCLNAKHGVGLARKIGTDIALHLYAQKKLRSPWLYQTDADAQLPPDYFSTRLTGHGAVVFGHTHHSPQPLLARAAELYDLHMRYYVDGLARAGSSYAYPTLGSTIAIHANAYAAVRGYPKRNAAEDFYLLNKVAKIAQVTYHSKPTLVLQARPSNRVPFGTGPTLAKISKGLETDPTGRFYLSYHPASFNLLARTLTYLDKFANDLSAPPAKISAILASLGFDKVRDVIAAKYPTPARRAEVLQQWFDAGKSLRFIHQARRYYPDQSLLQSLGLQNLGQLT